MSKDHMESLAPKQLANWYDYLAPDGSEIRLLPDVSGGGLAHCLLPKGGISAAVTHQTVEEIWYFISGKGQVWRKLKEVERIDDVGPGVGLTIPRETSFQFRNLGEDPLCFVIATIPGWPGPQEAQPVRGYWESVEGSLEDSNQG